MRITRTLFLAPFLLCPVFAAEPQLVGHDAHKQLVLDTRVIASVEGARLMPGAVVKDPRGALFQADKPWENATNNLYPNVLWDADEHIFKLWYKCVLADKDAMARMDPPGTIHDVGWYLLYATSRDGIAWEKPALGLHKFGGDAATNIVARDTPNAGVFKDPHDPDATRRYKMIYDVGMGALRVRFSPDGIHWGEPGEPTGFGPRQGDTHNNAWWDARLGRYVCITRQHFGERLVACADSADFLHWENGALALRSGVEEGRARQTYCLPSFPYANVWLGYAMLYNVGGDRTVDCELAWSPDTVRWFRVAPGVPLIPRGEKGAGDSGCIYAPAGPAIAQDGRLLIFYGGSAAVHEGWKRSCLLHLARLRTDGWAGYEPVEKGRPASVTTAPLVATGEPLRVSADGALRVRVLDTALESEPIEGALTDAEVRWREGGDFRALRGKSVRLRFDFTDAKLYAFSGLALPDDAKLPAPRPPSLARSGGKPVAVASTFATGADGWQGYEKITHHADGGARGGFVSIERKSAGPYASSTFAQGNWPEKFGGGGARISFQVRAAQAGGGVMVELFAGDIAQWTFAKAGELTADWREAAALVRWDWTDAEAEAAGWRRAAQAFSWRDTLTHAGKLVIIPAANAPATAFDLDEVLVETLEP